jgi:hypothetical protein
VRTLLSPAGRSSGEDEGTALLTAAEAHPDTRVLPRLVRASLLTSPEGRRVVNALLNAVDSSSSSSTLGGRLGARVAQEVAVGQALTAALGPTSGAQPGTSALATSKAAAAIHAALQAFTTSFTGLHPTSAAARKRCLSALQPLAELQEVITAASHMAVTSRPAGESGIPVLAALRSLVASWVRRLGASGDTQHLASVSNVAHSLLVLPGDLPGHRHHWGAAGGLSELPGRASPDAATSAWLLDVRTAALDKLMTGAMPANNCEACARYSSCRPSYCLLLATQNM